MIPLLLWLSFSHRFNDSPMNWYTANNFCKRMKAKLLEIDSSKENKKIWKEIKKRGFKWQKKQFWLGLTDRRREGQWVYESTGRVFVFVFLLSLNLNCDSMNVFAEARVH